MADKWIWHNGEQEQPSDDRLVLCSFSNFSLPCIGRYEEDEDGGGNWYIGDSEETFLSKDLFVDGWWELPEKPEVDLT